ncbi:peptidoglycan endopeptidase [Prosthecobacter sp.]|uniref:peptidoglycan endopeptidase n=1 Tax=Prosthecobacter sp. TaxID=1965333 RepID=UPI00378359AF
MAPPAIVPLYFNGLYAFAHESHPAVVHQLVAAANELVGKPYKWGGGHQYLFDNGFDCSGSVSHVLYRAKLLDRPLSSVAFARYAWAGVGSYVTVFVNPGHHVFMHICGLRFDTSGALTGEGPRWRVGSRSYAGFYPRHPAWL